MSYLFAMSQIDEYIFWDQIDQTTSQYGHLSVISTDKSPHLQVMYISHPIEITSFFYLVAMAMSLYYS